MGLLDRNSRESAIQKDRERWRELERYIER